MVSGSKAPDTDSSTLLTDLIRQVKLVNEKLDSLIELNEKILDQDIGRRPAEHRTHSVSTMKLTPDAMSLLTLPMSLRKTVMVLYKLDRATAEDLARETGRLRAVESSSANQLVRMGYLSKKREGRDTYFFIETSTESRK